jgi:hypothetical protein
MRITHLKIPFIVLFLDSPTKYTPNNGEAKYFLLPLFKSQLNKKKNHQKNSNISLEFKRQCKKHIPNLDNHIDFMRDDMRIHGSELPRAIQHQ